MVHETPDCSSLRLPGAAVNATNVRPVSLRDLIALTGENVTETVTPGALATDEDMPTDDPVMTAAKVAGNDPCELAAITLFEPSKIAASTAELDSALAGRLKVPNENVSNVLADISAPKTTSISDDVKGKTREEEMIFAAPSDGEITDVKGGKGSPDKGRATRVMTSFEPEGTRTAGLRVTVIATPVLSRRAPTPTCTWNRR